MWGWEREQKRRKVGLDLPKPLLTMDGEGWEHWKCRRAHHAAGYFFLKHFLLFCMRWREGGAAVRWRPSIRYACATLLNYITLYYANFFFFDIFSLFRRFFEGPFLKVPFSPLKCPKKKQEINTKHNVGAEGRIYLSNNLLSSILRYEPSRGSRYNISECLSSWKVGSIVLYCSIDSVFLLSKRESFIKCTLTWLMHMYSSIYTNSQLPSRIRIDWKGGSKYV